MSERRSTFIERVLDGHARIDLIDSEVAAWLEGPRKQPLHIVLGLDADELDLVANTPDSLRYLLHARRFDRSVRLQDLRNQASIRRHASRLASVVVDPFDAARIEGWLHHVDSADSRAHAELEPSHA